MSEYTNIKEDVLKKLEQYLPYIQEQFGIETIGVCGSISRGDVTPESDVDLLISFQKGHLHFANLGDYLEDPQNGDRFTHPVSNTAPPQLIHHCRSSTVHPPPLICQHPCPLPATGICSHRMKQTNKFPIMLPITGHRYHVPCCPFIPPQQLQRITRHENCLIFPDLIHT